MLNNLQALRAIAALMVVLVHVGAIGHLGIGQGMVFGHAGVDLFFVISGFVMVYTIWKRPIGPGGFLLNRVIRIVPLYWGFTAGLFLLSLAGLLIMQPAYANWVQFALSMLFIPYRSPAGEMQPLYFLGWTLNMEMAFYALFALGIALFGVRLNRLVLSCALAIMLIAVTGASIKPDNDILAFYTAPIIVQFALGMVLALGFIRGLTMPEWMAWALLFGGGAFLFIHPELGIGTHQFWLLPATGAVVAGAIGLEHHGRGIHNRAILLIGAASYALYLSHPFATAAADRLSARVDAAYAPTVAMLFAIPVAIILSITIHLAFERPVTDRLRRLIAHGRSAVSRQEDGLLSDKDHITAQPAEESRIRA